MISAWNRGYTDARYGIGYVQHVRRACALGVSGRDPWELAAYAAGLETGWNALRGGGR